MKNIQRGADFLFHAVHERRETHRAAQNKCWRGAQTSGTGRTRLPDRKFPARCPYAHGRGEYPRSVSQPVMVTESRLVQASADCARTLYHRVILLPLERGHIRLKTSSRRIRW